MKYEKLIQSLTHNRYKVSYFETVNDAVAYIVGEVHDATVGFGDSATIASIGLAECLSKRNSVVDPFHFSGAEFLEVSRKALTTEVFFTSVNGVAETGELVNVDGTGNRIAGSLFGHKKVFFVFGQTR